MSSTEYIHNLSCDNIRVAGVGLEDTCVPNVGWINETYVAQSNFGNDITTSISSLFANKTHLDSINQSLSSTTIPTFAQLNLGAAPTSSLQAATKGYVDSVSSIVTAGAGIVKVGTTLSVALTLPHVTSVNNFLDSNSADVYLRSPGKTLHVGGGSSPSPGDCYFGYNNPNRLVFCNGANFKMELNSAGVRVLDTSDSTSTSSGALTVAGGASIAKELWCGTLRIKEVGFSFAQSGGNNYVGLDANSYILFDKALKTFQIVSSGATDSTSGTNGAVTINGGLGVMKNINSSGEIRGANFNSGNIWNSVLTAPGLTTVHTMNESTFNRVGKQVQLFGVVRMTSVSGTQTGNLTITLPQMSGTAFTWRNIYAERNGVPISNPQLNTTVNGTTATVTSNGAQIPIAQGDVFMFDIKYLFI